jgi:CDP-diacylglycerol--glycerol-3-phosphate 3-phosphatidyltransferase
MRITANQVTLTRLLFMPLLAWLIYGDHTQQLVAVVIGTLVGLTDWLDGWMARRQGPTVLGGLMDPIADKVFIALTFVPFADRHYLPWELCIALFLREYLVTALRSSFEYRQRVLRSTLLAKIKTWTQMESLALVLLMIVVRSHTVLTWVFIALPTLPLVGAIVFTVLGRGPRRVLWLAFLMHATFAFIFMMWGPQAASIAVAAVMVALTWISATDYMIAAFGLISSPTSFDLGRMLPAAVLPIVTILALARHTAPIWAIAAVMAIEFAHGGLDNLLAHHKAGASGWVWGGRMVLIIGAFAMTFVRPELKSLLGAVAVFVSASGAIYTFWTRRRFYLEARLRDEPREGVTEIL